MGEAADGSSDAAQRAQSDSDSKTVEYQGAPEASDMVETQERGFFGRLVQALSPSDTDETDKDAVIQRVNSPMPGLGNLRRMRVDDVLIPKAEVVALSDTAAKEEVYEVFKDSGLTRLPVYSGTLDTPIGFVHLKDFALQFGFNGKGETFDLTKLVRPLLFVPPSMPLGVLLTKMQADRVHIALVIDEYGGTDGLVTIEDLIEQVVGEIEDEHDTEEDKLWSEEKPGCFLVQARTPLDEFEAEIGMSLTRHEEIDGEEVDTLGGLVFMLSGRVPARGEIVPHPGGPEFEVVDADPRRIKRLRVYVPSDAGV
ncbi:hemolysin family protein [Shimia ponticola]|uniref:hemolysin family protein n=1 Tax=Shimia ponticola TaxID=2582893 RepID=UPI0011BDD550|nr:hemolysin family protein [Shimia ponticola]